MFMFIIVYFVFAYIIGDALKNVTHEADSRNAMVWDGLQYLVAIVKYFNGEDYILSIEQRVPRYFLFTK